MNLDREQLEVVQTSEHNVVVVAGAGSGKTRVVTERIKYLLNNGVIPSSIVSITFTNNAADEMKQRLVDIEGIGDVFIGTIHSFANRIFSNSNQSYQILTSEVRLELMRELLLSQNTCLDIRRYLQYLDAQQLIEQGKLDEDSIGELFSVSELVAIRELTNTKQPPKLFTQNMYTLMKARNIIDFDTLLKLATDYFISTNQQLDYLFVDEFQDVGTLEQKFLVSLNAKNNLFVGDDWQAIYSFKGGNVNYFKALVRNDKWKTYYLQNNYRSCEEIINTGKKVISQVDSAIDKNVVCMNKNKGYVKFYSKYKVDEILKLELNKNLKDWFLLVRTNKDLFMMEEKLQQLNIPYTTFKRSQQTLEQLKESLDEDKVKLLTVHAAKGLESKNVILYGYFPLYQPEYLKNDDERRVMYVGVTRAIDRLIVLN